jgi:hypothetical protein
MFKEQVSVSGFVSFYVYENGVLVDERHVKNLVVTSGKEYIAGRMSGTPPTVMSHMALGGTPTPTPPLLTDTLLNNELGRVALSSTVVTGREIKYTAAFPAGTATSPNISEAAIFNASSAGTMLARTTFSPFDKTSTAAIVVVWTISIS